jgi:hypothetical protein
MFNLQDFIKNLQEKPYEVRTRILWASSAVASVLVFGIWLTTFKNNIQNLNIRSSFTSAANTTPVSATHYINIDRAVVDQNLNLYFTVKNDTTDILNLSKLSDIKLVLNGKDYTPSKITDLSSKAFIQKSLSHTQSAGILTFDNVTSGQGSITFDNLNFEQSTQNLFKEVIDVNVSKLKQ